jgi:DNA-directed RNA polymerase specialized sigma24 family protein
MKASTLTIDETRMIASALESLPAEIRDDFRGVAFLKIVELRESPKSNAEKLKSLTVHLWNEAAPILSGHVKRRPPHIKTSLLSQVPQAEIDGMENSSANHGSADIEIKDILDTLPARLRHIARMLMDGSSRAEIAAESSISERRVGQLVAELQQILSSHFNATRQSISPRTNCDESKLNFCTHPGCIAFAAEGDTKCASHTSPENTNHLPSQNSKSNSTGQTLAIAA